ncbi:MAG: DUF4159 domain-containing protein [Candidatus Eisenbacteria bacterium]|nr:DUF4159 domain-containing protein [Candidatus Eisenbacteria bacterium]
MADAELAAVVVLASSLCFAPTRGATPDAAPPGAREFSIGRLKYGGGGDWYEDRTSLVNLLRAVRDRTSIRVAADHEVVVEPGSAAIFQYPFAYACGHGNMKFTDAELRNLRRYLDAGGFLWVDDDFGIDPSFRREMKRLFPDSPLLELPFSHPVFHQLYDFPGGLPKIHEHDGGPARAFGIVHQGRLVVFYSFDTDLGDGLEDPEIHHDPPEKREAALQMALNIVHFALSQ